MEYFKGKNILVTGGTGSLGHEIVRKLLKASPNVIRIYSRDETKQFHLQQELREHKNIRYLLGDIRDSKRLSHAVKDIDVIFHVAALKHVLACEYNPFEALKTNILGTANIIEAANNAGVKKLIFTSTDKATNPCNTMGVSKLFAERLITAGQFYSGAYETVMCSVRFGNVIGSRGSFIPLIKKQIQHGGPITLTHPDMTRFFMSISDALDLLLDSIKVAKGGEVFILKMPVIKIKDLMEVVIEGVAPDSGYKPEDIKVEQIGIKPGEKMYEELITHEEMERAMDLGNMYVLTPQIEELNQCEYVYKDAKLVEKSIYSSREEKVLSKQEIKDMLIRAGELKK